MSRDKLSFIPTISKPCGESWAAMNGGQRTRHCDVCEKQVFNFAAMTSHEIEKLARQENGRLCARITHRADGSLVTLDSARRNPFAAQLIVSASLACGATTLAAQSYKEPELQSAHPSSSALAGEAPGADKGQALLTGTIMKNDASGPKEGVMVSLRASGPEGPVVAEARSNDCGKFQISAPVGTYDFEAAAGAERIRFKGIPLVAGEQSVGAISTAVSTVEVTAFAPGESYTTMGSMAVTIYDHWNFWKILRHPIRYARYRKQQE